MFDDVGGFDERFGGWGGEDLELGFRLFTRGADVVPLTDALCLHLGLGTSATRGAEIDQRTQLAPFIPHYSLRGAGRPDLTSPAGLAPIAQVQLSVATDGAAPGFVRRAEQMIADDPFTDVERVDVDSSVASFPNTETAAPLQIHLDAATTLPRHPISRLWRALHDDGEAATAQLPDGRGLAVRTRAVHRDGFDFAASQREAIVVATDTRPPSLPEIADRSRRATLKTLLGRVPAPATRPLTSLATRAYTEIQRRK